MTLAGLWQFRESEYGVMSFTHINVRPALTAAAHHKLGCLTLGSLQVSKENYCFSDYPFPDETPDYPHHTQMAAYVNSYVDHFDLRRHIRFNTTVTRLSRDEAGEGWTLEVEERRGVGSPVKRSLRARFVAIATGHHTVPSYPTFPGLEDRFQGKAEHSVHYNDAEYNEAAPRPGKHR